MSLRSTREVFCHLATCMFLLTSVVGCASVEPQQTEPVVIEKVVLDDGLASANFVYNTKDYEAAIEAFKAITLKPTTSASNRRMSYLGQALIYLGSDKNLHSIENAKLALGSASQVVSAENEEFTLESDMLMDAVIITIGSQSRYTELLSKSGKYNSEIARLKSERDTLLGDNKNLLEEQATLNDALERLKNLTLGN